MTEEDEAIIFVNILNKNKCLLDKCQTPNSKNMKAKALEEFCQEYTVQCGRKIDGKQVLKRLANMKTRVKQKTDLTRTGNKPIKLLGWEKELMKVVETEENPVYCKIPGKFWQLLYGRLFINTIYLLVGALSAGIPSEASSSSTPVPVSTPSYTKFKGKLVLF